MKKRFETANQIRDAIDAAEAKAIRFMNEGAALDLRASEILRIECGAAHAVEEADWLHKQANRARSRAERVRKVRLVALKNKLAEFLTMQLPGIDNGDPSVPVKG